MNAIFCDYSDFFLDPQDHYKIFEVEKFQNFYDVRTRGTLKKITDIYPGLGGKKIN